MCVKLPVRLASKLVLFPGRGRRGLAWQISTMNYHRCGCAAFRLCYGDMGERVAPNVIMCVFALRWMYLQERHLVLVTQSSSCGTAHVGVC